VPAKLNAETAYSGADISIVLWLLAYERIGPPDDEEACEYQLRKL
jgi:hypothetical protein